MINVHFKSILELLKAFPDEQTCINHLTVLRWGGVVISPFDENSKVYICKNNKYRCKNTGKYFNVKTNTLFDNTKIELQKWFMAIYLITSHKKGISSLQLSRDIDVTQKTAWFMLQRIRNCFGINQNEPPMKGTVEVDETYVGGKDNNKHVGLTKTDKVMVVGAIQRGGFVRVKAQGDEERGIIGKFVLKNVDKGAKLITDQSSRYNLVKLHYDHQYVNHSKKEYVRGEVHTQNIENFWSMLKRGIIGIYHFASRKHLQKYVNEFAFRYNTRICTDAYRFNILLSNTENRLTYKELIANGK